MLRQFLVLLVLPATLVAGEAAPAPTLQTRLLNAIGSPSFGQVGGWNLDSVAARSSTSAASPFSSASVEVYGTTKSGGGKIDIPAFKGELPGCRRLSLWVAPKADSNVKDIGFQICDAKGEWLLKTIPVDWTGWRQVVLDLDAAGWNQAYEQKNQDGKVDLPLTGVHLVWMTKTAGPFSLVINGLTAGTEVKAGADGMTLTPAAADVAEPGRLLEARFFAENRGAAEKKVEIRWTLQANPTFAESEMPDPVLGFDHARGCKNTVVVDGKEMGDAKMCDGDDGTAFSTPWASFKEAVATIDLGQVREVTAIRWQSGDANKLWKGDVSVSVDGTTFQPVEGAQNVDFHAKWGRLSVPWPKPVKARQIRFRFHNNGVASKDISLPPTMMVYDGIANDPVSVPQVGPLVASGAAAATVPARGLAEVLLRSTDPIGPGGYLLGIEQTIAGHKDVSWSNFFVRPADQVDTERTRRIGINGGGLGVIGDEMRRCGFGWMRFENCKWSFYSNARDHYFFDGSLNPFVNHDKYFSGFQKLGIKVLPYVFMTPDWATSAKPGDPGKHYAYPPKDDADYGEAIFQLVARYGSVKTDPAKLKTKDKLSGLKLIDAVELWNEPNFNNADWGAFLGSMPRFFELMRAGAEGARRADPSMIITSCGLAGIDIELVNQFSEYKYADGKTPIDVVDVMNVHFYSGKEEPEICGWDPNLSRDGATAGATYPEQIADVVAWRDKVKPKAEVWLTETGNDVGGPIGRTERYQATKLPRCVMIALAAGVEKVMIYRETGSDPAMHAGAGLLRNDNSVRPSWFTVATMIRQLQGFNGRALRLPSDDPKVWMFLWEDGQRKLITAWRYEGTSKLGVDLGKATVCDGFGRTTAAASTAGVVLSELPTYITVTAPGPGFDKLVAAGREQVKKLAAERARLAAVPASLYDFGPVGQQVGMLKGYGMPRRYTPVSQDMLWNEKTGFGWLKPGKDEEQRWIPDPLERDSCHINAENVFRFRLPPGKHRLSVSAEPWSAKGVIAVKTAVGEQKVEITKQKHVAQFTVEGGAQPMEVSVDGQYLMKWISAIGDSAKP
jgi:hypothetical protein